MTAYEFTQDLVTVVLTVSLLLLCVSIIFVPLHFLLEEVKRWLQKKK